MITFSYDPQPTSTYFVRSQRSDSPSTSSTEHAASSIPLIPSISSRLFSVQPPLPPSLSSMFLRLALISPITRPSSSQPSSLRGRPVLLRLPVCPPHVACLPPASVPCVASSVHLASAPLKLFLFVHHPCGSESEPDSAVTLMDSITSDVQTLPFSVPLSTT